MAKQALPKEWCEEARLVLRMEMMRKGVSYKQLEKGLRAMGIDCDHKMLSTKISRGGFSFVFFLQCMYAMDVEYIRIQDPKFVKRPPGSVEKS